MVGKYRCRWKAILLRQNVGMGNIGTCTYWFKSCRDKGNKSQSIWATIQMDSSQDKTDLREHPAIALHPANDAPAIPKSAQVYNRGDPSPRSRLWLWDRRYKQQLRHTDHDGFQNGSVQAWLNQHFLTLINRSANPYVTTECECDWSGAGSPAPSPALPKG